MVEEAGGQALWGGRTGGMVNIINGIVNGEMVKYGTDKNVFICVLRGEWSRIIYKHGKVEWACNFTTFIEALSVRLSAI